MKLTSFKYLFALLFSVLLLTGCESNPTTDDDAGEEGQSTSQQADGASASADGSDGANIPEEPEVSEEELAAQKAKEAAMKEQAALREVRTFYFDFDQSVVKAESRAALAAHAAFLSANPSSKVVLEGHCDERGTKEYNVALGESRAKSVKRFLIVNGVADAQIETISYGEELPAEQGSDEAAWSKNRRVYIEYK